MDSNLFGAILRTFISSRDGVEWVADTECVFDGLENVRERVATWYQERLSEEKAQDLVREDEKDRAHESQPKPPPSGPTKEEGLKEAEYQARLPEGLILSVSEPIVDRKSVFIGRACKISHPSQVSKFKF